MPGIEYRFHGTVPSQACTCTLTNPAGPYRVIQPKPRISEEMKNGHCIAPANTRPSGSRVRTHQHRHRHRDQQSQDGSAEREERRVEHDLPEAGVGEQPDVVLGGEDPADLVERAVEDRLVEGGHDRGEHQHGQEGQHRVLHPPLPRQPEGTPVAGLGEGRALSGPRRARRVGESGHGGARSGSPSARGPLAQQAVPALGELPAPAPRGRGCRGRG